MTTDHRVLLLGATGRTGGRVLTRLLEQDVAVRALVRSPSRLPAGVTAHPLLDVVVADIGTLSTVALAGHLDGCDTVVSCLGHNVSLRGLFGPPRDLVAGAVRRVREAAQGRPTADPVRLVLMSSVSVNLPDRADSRRGNAERAYLAALRAVLPPVRDNQQAADILLHEVGADDPQLQWVAVRPDTLIEGDDAPFALHDTLVASIWRPDRTRMSQVAHVICDLVTDDGAWQQWRSRMPVLVDAGAD
jgi:nucleoside-diphosphate-sugar epimerase